MSAPHPFPPDPLGPGGIAAFGRRLRGGATTAAATTEAFLARIEAFDGRLGAFEHVAAEDGPGFGPGHRRRARGGD